MSTNIHIVATRDIKVLKTGQITQQETYYEPTWQTPTVVTQNIINDPEPIAAYKEWVLNISHDQTRVNNPVLKAEACMNQKFVQV